MLLQELERSILLLFPGKIFCDSIAIADVSIEIVAASIVDEMDGVKRIAIPQGVELLLWSGQGGPGLAATASNMFTVDISIQQTF